MKLNMLGKFGSPNIYFWQSVPVGSNSLWCTSYILYFKGQFHQFLTYIWEEILIKFLSINFDLF